MRRVSIVDLPGLRAPAIATLDGSRVIITCSDIGFLSVVGTGMDPRTTAAMRQGVEATFAVPEARKWEQVITCENYRGYIPFGLFTLYDGSGARGTNEGHKQHAETAADDPIRATDALYGPDRWPIGL